MQASKAFVQSLVNSDLKLEYEAARRVQSNLAQARNSIAKNLKANPDNWNSIRLAPILDEYLLAFEKQSVLDFDSDKMLNRGLNEGQQIVGEAARIDKKSAYWNWVPLLPINAISLAEADAAARITKVSAQVKKDILQRVQVGLATGASVGQMQDDILGVGLKGSKGRDGVFRSASVRAETIARTLSNELINRGSLMTYDQIDQMVPELGLQKIWQVISDNRTSDVCNSLANQTQPLDKPFSTGSWSGMNPPAHPNCRSRVTALSAQYVNKWDSRFPTSTPRTPPATKPPVVEEGRPGTKKGTTPPVVEEGRPGSKKGTTQPPPSAEGRPGSKKSTTSPELPKTRGAIMITANGSKQNVEDLLEAFDALESKQGKFLRDFVNQSNLEFAFLPEEATLNSQTGIEFAQNFMQQSQLSKTSNSSTYNLKWAERLLPQKGAGGFVYEGFPYVSIVSPMDAKLSGYSIEKVKEKYNNVIRNADNGYFSTTTSTPFINGTVEQLINTTIHEIGHQVDFSLQSGGALRPRNARSLTKYANTDDNEWTAEHFTFWATTPEAYKEADPVGYAQIDSMVDKWYERQNFINQQRNITLPSSQEEGRPGGRRSPPPPQEEGRPGSRRRPS